MKVSSVERTPWTAEGENKRQEVRRIFADIAPRYDCLNGLMSLSLHHRWRRAAVASLLLLPGQDALDVCCGTGDFMGPLKRAVGKGGRVVGLDFCLPMLRQAKSKAHSNLTAGDACRLPFRSGSFDGLTVGWGIRNLAERQSALSEFFRVLRPSGHFVSLDMARPKNRILRTVSDAAFHKIVPALGSLFGHREAYTYLPESSDRFLSPESLATEFAEAGFTDIWVKRLMLGNIAMVGGRRP